MRKTQGKTGVVEFQPGQLVFCETDYGCWVGEVRKVQRDHLEVKWFSDGTLLDVSQREAIPFSRYLAEESRPKKLKTIYSFFYGGNTPKRMSGGRLKPFFKILRQHGVDFDESLTSAGDYFRMRMNPAHSGMRQSRRGESRVTVSDEVVGSIPKWLVPDELPPSSRDPLGLEADAGKLADRLLPGLTVFTSRAGYFFFLAWAIRELNSVIDVNFREKWDLLYRLERAVVLCETLNHGKEELRACLHLGQRSKPGLLTDATRAKIPDRILKNQTNSGCYNLYRTSMESCGFVQQYPEGIGQGLLPFKLTPRGERLADLFSKRSGSDALLGWARNGEGKDVRDLRGWGKSHCFGTFRHNVEKKCFLEGLLYARKDAASVVNAANIRLQTLRTLQRAHLFNLQRRSGRTVTTMIANDLTDGDVSEIDSEEGRENIDFLMHFYNNRSPSGADPFVDAAVYELLGLALNAVFKGLLDTVQDKGRTNIGDWIDSLKTSSKLKNFWNSTFRGAAASIPSSEETILEKLFETFDPVENGLMLAAKVFTHSSNQAVLAGHLANKDVRILFDQTFFSHEDTNMAGLLEHLIRSLVPHHHRNSERKGKERWLDIDGNDVLAVDPHPMSLGFHSYRFPQIISLARDIGLERGDLLDAE
jgi:hypothetical protein